MTDLIEIPQATPATPDLICWLWAAIPQRDGQINISRTAARFGVSRTTIRRWITDPVDRELNHAGLTRARQLAILRGHGTYLWPGLDEATQFRNQTAWEFAQRAQTLLDSRRGRAEWHTNGTLDPHTVMLVHWPRAHVHTIAIASIHKSVARLERKGEIITSHQLPNRWAAELVKYQTLASYSIRRCITPRTLVPVGRTDAIRDLPRSRNPPQLTTDTASIS